MIIVSGKAMVKIECVVNTRGVLMPSVNIFSYIYNNVNKYSSAQKRDAQVDWIRQGGV